MHIHMHVCMQYTAPTFVYILQIGDQRPWISVLLSWHWFPAMSVPSNTDTITVETKQHEHSLRDHQTNFCENASSCTQRMTWRHGTPLGPSTAYGSSPHTTGLAAEGLQVPCTHNRHSVNGLHQIDKLSQVSMKKRLVYSCRPEADSRCWGRAHNSL